MMSSRAFSMVGAVFLMAVAVVAGAPDDPPIPQLHAAPDRSPLPGTAPLRMEGDISIQLVEGVHRFLDAEIAASPERRTEWWANSSQRADFIPDLRTSLAEMIGIPGGVDGSRFEFYGESAGGSLLAKGGGYRVFTVRWPAFDRVTGTGLLLIPDEEPVADVLAIPDADVTPEQLIGVTPGVAPRAQYARRLAENGCRVLVPLLIDRNDEEHRMSMREFLNRPAFELGNHLIGYEIAKVLSGIQCLRAFREKAERNTGVIGWGEGGLLALYAAALREEVSAACVSGYFGPRERVWEEPSYRNVFGLLEQFGDAELAALIAPRTLVIEATPGPEIVVAPAKFNEQGQPVGGAYPLGKPGRLTTPTLEAVRSEAERARKLTAKLNHQPDLRVIESALAGSDGAMQAFLAALGGSGKLRGPSDVRMEQSRSVPDAEALHAVQAREIVDHNEALMWKCAELRTAYMSDLKTDSLSSFEKSVEVYRERFRKDVIGCFDREMLTPNPRSRKFQEGEGVMSYEVVLDVFPDVIAYGILTVPDGIQPGEKRPVVVCQHGLEGRPQDVVGESKFRAYKAFATRLAQRGFVTFAPQNLYLGQDRFRLLQFKANSIGRTLFSVMVPQHAQIVRWLGSLDFVDADRIGFYGLSYGGKSAMRIPPLVPGYALSICSGDFNEWVWKNCSTKSAYSYAAMGEYEIFEWGLGRTFNYAEMAALIAPRPFMVERGHFDGVAPDEMVAHEYAKVRRLYDQLGIGERTEIEWFSGPHTINAAGTFDFLHKWLEWPRQE